MKCILAGYPIACRAKTKIFTMMYADTLFAWRWRKMVDHFAIEIMSKGIFQEYPKQI